MPNTDNKMKDSTYNPFETKTNTIVTKNKDITYLLCLLCSSNSEYKINKHTNDIKKTNGPKLFQKLLTNKTIPETIANIIPTNIKDKEANAVLVCKNRGNESVFCLKYIKDNTKNKVDVIMYDKIKYTILSFI